MGLFNELKRVMSQALERHYWYSSRKIRPMWYDKDENKWQESKSLKAKEIANYTWNGEEDILAMMLLKIDHMFHNLRKNSVEKHYYIFGQDIIKYGTYEDKMLIVRGAVNETFKDKKRVWLMLGHNIKEVSKTAQFYLQYDDVKNTIILSCDYDKKSDIIREWKVSDRCDLGITVTDFISALYKRVLQEYTEQNDIELNDGIRDIDTDILAHLDASSFYYSFPMKDVCRLSPALKKHAMGSFVKCRDLLHLRRLVKNVMRIDELDDRYSTWRGLDSSEEKSQKIEECNALFMSDRKKAYRKIADFMAEKGLGWWD